MNNLLQHVHKSRKERIDVKLGVEFDKKGSSVDAKVVNMSSGGLCFMSEGTLKPKDILRLKIPLTNTGEQISLNTEVVWCEPMDPKYRKAKPVKKTAKGKKPKVKKTASRKIPDNIKCLTGIRFIKLPLAKSGVINEFINKRKDEIIRHKIGLINIPTQ